ncbi:MAG: DUF1294 domain-containing protein [Gammaproteobacteria bacterium]|nr:DUF1294 domain-containing protein [Gammaproteobacteria bacterium]
MSQASTSPFRLFAIVALIAIVAFSGLALFFTYRWFDVPYQLSHAVAFLLAYLIGVNLTTLIFYIYDKSVAGGQRIRIPERTLLTLALIGGSPAAILGGRWLRHKTIKRSYNRWLAMVVILQAAIVAALIYYFESDQISYRAPTEFDYSSE